MKERDNMICIDDIITYENSQEWIIESYIIDSDNVTGYVCRNIRNNEYKIFEEIEF
ncbi:hypothetical protein [Clostridium sp. RO3]|uniref:hypothetical protein n=1 Tax=Clostridium sp. RO3 TaxID=2949984 RepID=UPI00130EB9F4|nr:hypothetical protein [Clostridium sp. RO3]MBY6985132.1 hypothetical protein [Clostridium botulinum]